MQILEVRNIGNRGQQVIFVRHRERIAARIVSRLLQQNCPDGLCQATRNLSLNDGGIDDRSAVFARYPALDFHEAGIRINFDDAGMCGAGKGDRWWVISVLRLQTLLSARRQASRLAVGYLGDLPQASCLLGSARHGHESILQSDTFGIRLEDMRRNAFDLVFEQRSGSPAGTPANHTLAATRGTRPEAAP